MYSNPISFMKTREGFGDFPRRRQYPLHPLIFTDRIDVDFL
jgi:hypothetical protein